MKDFFKIMGYLITVGVPVFILYVAFNPDFNATFIHEEKCICDKNLTFEAI